MVTRNFSFDYDGKRNNLVLAYGRRSSSRPRNLRRHEPEASNWAPAQPAEPAGGGDRRQGAGWRAALVPRLQRRGRLPAHRRQAPTGWRGARLPYNLFRLVANNRIDASQMRSQRLGSGVETRNSPRRGSAGRELQRAQLLHHCRGGDANPTGSNRGALTVAEFELQRTKIVSAITRPNADVVGLMEIENNGYGDNSAIANLVGPSTPPSRTRRITTAGLPRRMASPSAPTPSRWALIYRPAKVTPEGPPASSLPVQQAEAVDASGKPVTINQGMRGVAGAALQLAQGGCALTLVVKPPQVQGLRLLRGLPRLRHSRSPRWPGPLQRAAGLRRQGAGETLGDLAGDLLLIGDMNAYGMEDPIRC